MKLLIVEDNKSLSESIEAFMTREGVVCENAYNYKQAIDKIISFDYDVVILDLMLPDGDGLDILKTIKEERKQCGVLILSAKNSTGDKIKGLNLGADDYLAKPFQLTELNARLNAINRRKKFDGHSEIQFKEMRIDTVKEEIKVHGKPVTLTRKEYELLLFFLSNKERIITRQTIAEHLWGDYMDLNDSFDFVYTHIKNLRKKLTAHGCRDFITTRYGAGYKFKSTIE
jgi:DNA-binding response OmpR family regulator